MRQYYFTFRSVTAAMEGQKALERVGIRASMARTPMQLRNQGCGYSLKVTETSYAATVAILSKGERRYQKCYERLASGQWQEVGA